MPVRSYSTLIILITLTLITLTLITLSSCTIIGTGFKEVGSSGDNNGTVVFLSVKDSKNTLKTDQKFCQFADTKKAPHSFPLKSNTIRDLVDKSRAAVVSIYAKTGTPVRAHLLGVPIPGIPALKIPGKALGSAVLCSPEGYLISNAHVINNAEKLEARLANGKSYKLDVIAVDYSADLSLMKIKTTGKFPYLKFAAAQRLREGDMVIAIGNPLGISHTVSHGIVSNAPGRRSHLINSEDKNSIPAVTAGFLISDTAINAGNSGGPLLDIEGYTVGINTAKVREAHGISLTIPTEQVLDFITNVKQKK